MRFLKQSTSVDVGIGPFLDSADGNSTETTLTLTQPDIRLKKNGGAWAQKAAAQTLTHEEAGWYELTLDATDTDTLGILLVAVHESGALPVWIEFHVVTANVYDSLFSTDVLDVSVTQWTGTNVAAPATAGYPVVTHKVGTGTGEINLSGGKAPATIAAGDLANDSITAAAVAAAAGAEIAAAVRTELATELARVDVASSTLATAANLATVAGYLDTEIAAIKLKTDALPTDPADASDVAALIGGVATVANAIKAKTDNLPSDPADASDVAALVGAIQASHYIVGADAIYANGKIDLSAALVKNGQVLASASNARADLYTLAGVLVDSLTTVALPDDQGVFRFPQLTRTLSANTMYYAVVTIEDALTGGTDRSAAVFLKRFS